MAKIRITKNRLYWLCLIACSQLNWIRKPGEKTYHKETERRMPEPVYMWLLENKLVSVTSSLEVFLTGLGERAAAPQLATGKLVQIALDQGFADVAEDIPHENEPGKRRDWLLSILHDSEFSYVP